VFYQGLENPLSITGGGGGEKINVTVDGAGSEIRKAGSGQYIVTCTGTGIAVVTVNDGKQTQKLNIPVKRVPDPTPNVGNKYPSGYVNASDFRIQTGVFVDLKDFIFEGVKFNVLSYSILAFGKGFDDDIILNVKGNAFSGEAKQLIRRCQPGTNITIANITVRDPAGKERTLEQTLTYKLQ
jgi:hypothetical protein